MTSIGSIWSGSDPLGLLGWSLLARATALLAAGAAAMSLLRRASPEARHLVGSLCLMGLLLLPALAWALPGLPIVPLPTAWRALLPAPPAAGSAGVEGGRADRLSVEMAGAVESSIAVSWSAPHRSSERRPRDLAPATSLEIWAWALWAVVAASLLIRWAVAVAGSHLLIREASELVGEPWRSQLSAALTAARGPLTTRLLASPRFATPIALGWRRPTIVVPVEFSRWPEARRRYALIHEAAHLRRQHCLLRALHQLACALYWFNPLVWWVERRVRLEQEHCCDNEVLLAGARPSEYAEHLLAIARAAGARRTTVFGVAMAGRSWLETRLRSILERRVGTLRPASASGLVLAGAAAIALVLTAATVQIAAAKDDHAVAEQQILWRQGDVRYEVAYKGRVELTDGENAVAHLEPGGLFRLREQRPEGTITEIEVTPIAGGTLHTTYRLDGVERLYDATGKAWMAHLLPEVIAQTGLGAKVRVGRLLREGGTEAVLAEVARMPLEEAQVAFLEELLRRRETSEDDLRKIAAAAPLLFASPTARVAFLGRLAPLCLDQPVAERAFFESLGSITDEELAGRMAARLIDGSDLGPGAKQKLFDQVAGRLRSPANQVLFLQATARECLASPALEPGFLAAVDRVSDPELLARLVARLLGQPGAGARVKARLMDTAGRAVKHDGDMAGLLASVGGDLLLSQDLRPAFFRAANTIESPGLRDRLVTQLLHDQRLDATVRAELERLRESGR